MSDQDKIYDRNDQLVTQGAFNALLSQLDWYKAERERLTLIEKAARNLGFPIDPHDYQEKMRRFQELRTALTANGLAQHCGGYYCSEEHGHIDCTPEKAI